MSLEVSGSLNILHGSAVAFGSQGLLILGPSGAGKSSLALQLIALGGALISDDQVITTERDGGLWLSAPTTIRDLIEARGFGLLTSPSRPAWCRAVVSLDEVETERLPKPRTTTVAGVSVPLFRKVETAAFPSILKAYLTGGVVDSGED